MFKNDLTKAYSSAVLFTFIVGFSFLGIKICVPYADTLHVLVHRFNFALLALVLLAVTKVVKIELKGKPKKNLLITAALYNVFILFQVMGLYYATSIEGSIIFAMVPAIVQVIAAVFLKEKPTWIQVCFILLSVTSLIVMVVLGSSEITFSPLGVVLLLISSLAMAMNNVFTRYISRQYKPIEISTAIIVAGTILFNLLFFGRGLIFGNPQTYFEPFQHPDFVIAVCYLGVGCILASAQIMAYLQSKLQSAKAAVFGNVSTAISILAGALILGEPLYAYHIICSVFIVAGALGINFAGRRGGKNEIRISDGK